MPRGADAAGLCSAELQRRSQGSLQTSEVNDAELDAAIAAQALRDLGHAKVAVLGVDYHHGNGTQTIFYERADVFTASVHGDPATEYPFFLGHADERGAGEGTGFNLNLPLPRGTGFAA